MKKKELRNIAKQIAECEQKIRSLCTTDQEKYELRDMVMRLSDRVSSIEDILELDELIQEYLNV